MIVNRLENIPKENDLTKILFNVFADHRSVLQSFLQRYASINDFDDIRTAELWRNIYSGIPDMYFESHKYVLVFENKMKAGFTKEQLPRYIEGSKVIGKENKYFLIAPDTTRYRSGSIPPEYIRLTWDDIYDFLQTQLFSISQEHQVLIESVLSRYRYLHYCTLFDNLYNLIADFSNIHSQELFSKDNYHSRHILIDNFADLKFSIGIYLTAPSYIKLNPWWVSTRNGNYKIIDSNTSVRRFRDKLYDLPNTFHALEKGEPGYIVDIKLSSSNTDNSICTEIVGLINNECAEMIRLYKNMNL